MRVCTHKYTIERNKTYRLRLVNTGSFASIRFSVDNHSLTLIEADGTLLAPTEVAGVTVAVAQRYSVLLYATQTSSPNGTYWMRATVQSDMFTYDQPGQNLDIRGVIRYCVFPAQQQHSFLTIRIFFSQLFRRREKRTSRRSHLGRPRAGYLKPDRRGRRNCVLAAERDCSAERDERCTHIIRVPEDIRREVPRIYE